VDHSSDALTLFSSKSAIRRGNLLWKWVRSEKTGKMIPRGSKVKQCFCELSDRGAAARAFYSAHQIGKKTGV